MSSSLLPACVIHKSKQGEKGREGESSDAEESVIMSPRYPELPILFDFSRFAAVPACFAFGNQDGFPLLSCKVIPLWSLTRHFFEKAMNFVSLGEATATAVDFSHHALHRP